MFLSCEGSLDSKRIISAWLRADRHKMVLEQIPDPNVEVCLAAWESVCHIPRWLKKKVPNTI